MKSLWNDKDAALLSNLIDLRVYSSRLLGQEPDLVLHGGGNTSVKVKERDILGEEEELLYVKGSGWDLATIERAGFAPVRLRMLLKMAKLKELSDTDMVKFQRAAMTEPNAPTPSVEAILHAIIPARFVDHTHADAVVTVTNTPDSEKKIREIYGDRVFVVPYVMPGFELAQTIFNMTRELDWNKYDGMILMHHGVFTFHDDAKESYSRMIKLVSQAEEYLCARGAIISTKSAEVKEDLLGLAKLRHVVSKTRGGAVVARLCKKPEHAAFSTLQNLAVVATRGPLTPDHVIRTKPHPLVLNGDMEGQVKRFADEYFKYFERNTNKKQKALDPAPRWVVWPEHGTVCFGDKPEAADIVLDIVDHTIRAIQQAEAIGGWHALPEKELFAVEYWVLEQAKLKKPDRSLTLQGKIALVTGAASGIGKACALSLMSKGASVIGLDLNAQITTLSSEKAFLGMQCDVTDGVALRAALQKAIRSFGGLDIVVSNAGIFSATENIADIKAENWSRSVDINLTSHQRLLQICIPYLVLGIDPAVIMVGSKNVNAPGPGAAAYSVAKAGLAQLARVAALELAGQGIRVNVIHPNQVFDTAIWTPEVLESRAKRYGMSVAEYKANNLLKVEITSHDVAELICAMAGPLFSKITGAQIPIDGGNERTI